MRGRMEHFAKPRMVAGEELGPIRRRDLEHRSPLRHYQLGEDGTVPCKVSSNQVYLLLSLRLFCGQIRQLVQSIQVRPCRRRNNVGVRAMARHGSSILLNSDGDFALGIGPAGDRLDDIHEEHTSELQSQSNLVCRLLLEKKK